MASNAAMTQLLALLQNTLSPERNTRKGAVASLQAMKGKPGFAMTLLSIVHNQAKTIQLGLQQAAALYFKNLVKEGWERGEGSLFAEEERTQIKALIVDLMVVVPASTQRQLSESLTIMSKSDYPEKWDSLMGNLIARLDTTDFNVINGILETANSICKRFRFVYDTTEVRKVLLYTLQKLQEPLLRINKMLMSLVPANKDNRDALIQVLKALRTVARIFFSLNWMVIPEFFENHIAEWMAGFLTLIKYNNTLLVDPDEDMEPGPIESVQAAVVENISLYAAKYEEEFESFFPTFVAEIWTLLTRCSTAPRYDGLVTTSLKFLKSVVQKKMHEQLFKDPARLKQILNSVILPNVVMTENDEDLFDENPVEYIRRDMEGTDTDTRRRTAAELVQTLVNVFPAEVTPLCVALCDTLLAEYATNPTANWKQKDTAITIFIASAVTASTRLRGASAINPGVDVGGFFAKHINPELQDSNPDRLPVVKASCIKFASTFRNQLPKAGLVALLPMIAAFLRAKTYVVHTYAASTIERMLTVRTDTSNKRGVPLTIQPADLAPMLTPLLGCLFDILLRENYPENEYIVRCLCRVVYSAKDQALGIAKPVLDKLTAVLAKISKDPRAPSYNHYVFECLAALVRNVCGANASAVATFEAVLFPIFNKILHDDVMEFIPYVFQVMGLLLHLRPPSTTTPRSNLSDAYKQMLKPILNVELWNKQGNVPALVMLMQNYIQQAPDYIVHSKNLVPTLGIFQKLVSLRKTENMAFRLLGATVENMTTEQLAPFIAEIFKVLIARQHSNKTVKYTRFLIEIICLIAGKHGGMAVFQSFARLNASFFFSAVKQLFLQNAAKITGRRSRRVVAIGFIRMLTECPALLEPAHHDAWLGLLTAIATLFELPEDTTIADAEELQETTMEQEAATEYTGTYSRLAYASQPVVDPFKDTVPSVRKWLAEKLAEMSRARPGQVPVLIAKAQPQVQTAVKKYLEAAKQTLA